MPLKENRMLRDEFDMFFMETYSRVKSFARQILMSEQDAEDISQDVFIKLLVRPEVWRNKEMRNNYLFKMTRNHIFNFIKHRNIERNYQQKIVEKNIIEEEFGFDHKLYAKEIELLISFSIERMPERRRMVFKMSRQEGKSNAEISRLLNMSVRTVERHLYLALIDLKKIVVFL